MLRFDNVVGGASWTKRINVSKSCGNAMVSDANVLRLIHPSKTPLAQSCLHAGHGYPGLLLS
jgi:hypothetical protein